jgi:hypothetical protein
MTGFRWGNLKERGHVEDMRRWEGNIKVNLEVRIWESVE